MNSKSEFISSFNLKQMNLVSEDGLRVCYIRRVIKIKKGNRKLSKIFLGGLGGLGLVHKNVPIIF